MYSEEFCGDESRKIKWDIVPYTRGRGLDIGSGKYKPFAHFIALDGNHFDNGMPDVFADITDLSLFTSESMDFVYSSHCLEHVDDYKGVLREWWRLVRFGGYLVLYLPHKDLFPSGDHPKANPDHKHDFVQEDIIAAMKANGGWTLLVNEYRDQDDEYSFFQVFQKRRDKKQWIPERAIEQPKSACVVRYGGFGDMMQTSSVIAALKSKGYRVTLMTSTSAHKLMQFDPNIDAYLMQDTDQVPNEDLGPYWDHWKKKFDLWVNLSESVEGTWLALPGRTNHTWPHHVRAKYLDENYLAFAHELAGVSDIKPRVKYHPSPENLAWAKLERQKMGGKVVLFTLSGSAVHKFYPHQDAVVAWIMLNCPDTKVIFTGDFACQILEQGWEDEERVLKWSGVVPIEKVLTFAPLCDAVIGPETGVLNVVAHEDVGKVVLLSHSSKNNLTRDWVNCVSLEPEECYCYPCHKLHYGWVHCVPVKDQDGINFSSLCMYNITPDRVCQALGHIL